MLVTWWSWFSGGLLPLLLSFPVPVPADQCITPQKYPHYVTTDMQEVDSLCYKCYHSTTQEFQVELRELRLGGLGSIMMYIDGAQKHFIKDCGPCPSSKHRNDVDSDKSDSGEERMVSSSSSSSSSVCQECDSAIPGGKLVELYVRLNQKPLGMENPCQNLSSLTLNLSLNIVKEKIDSSSDCDDGFSASFPLNGDTCIVNSTFHDTETRCLVPTCSDNIISPEMTSEKIEHKFKPNEVRATCVWQLNTEQRKHVALVFSQNIRAHITVFEESLMNPKWDVEWCPTFPNEFQIETDADTVFIVYDSSQKLTKKGTLSITTQADLCRLPPWLENGSVDFKRSESGTVAHYTCDKGFILHGPSELHCKRRAWDQPPQCVPHKEKLMSDAPMGSVESLEGVNGSVFTPENSTVVPPAPESDREGKMVVSKVPVEEEQSEEEMIENITEIYDILDESPPEVDRDSNSLHSNQSVSSDDVNEGEEDISASVNSTVLLDGTFGDGSLGGDDKEIDLWDKVMNLSLEDDMTFYIIVGAGGLLALIIILILSIVIYRWRYPVRLGLGRKFDTFQNPIYEKAVVRMPMQVEEPEVERKKSDAEEMSDCTVLE